MLELMVTVTVAAILFALAAPGMRDMVRNGELASTANDMIHALQLARTEAVRRQRQVVFCASLNPLAAAPTCSAPGAGAAWGQAGWIVFQDTNQNQQYAAANDVLIERHDLISTNLTIKSDGTGTDSYNPLGFAVVAAGAFVPSRNIVICDSRGNRKNGPNSTARAVLVTQTGRARVSALFGDVTTALTPIGACP